MVATNPRCRYFGALFREILFGGGIHLAAGIAALLTAFVVRRNLVAIVIIGMAVYSLLSFIFQ